MRRALPALIVLLGVSALGARPQLPSRPTGILIVPAEYPWGIHFEPGFSWEWARTEKTERYYFLVGDDTFVPEFPTSGGSQLDAARALGVNQPIELVELQVSEQRPDRSPHFGVAS